MKGTKRFGVPDSNPDSNYPTFQSKRLMVGSQFDFQRAEPSQPQSTGAPALDMRRAETSRQHVRALNTQFSSWVQSQLQNHPDELWEDGIRDYLTHASNIMEKFSDVVNWLKANAAKAESSSAVGSSAGPKKLGAESKNNDVKVYPEKPVTSSAPTTAVFASPGTTFGFAAQNKLVSEGKDGEIKLSPEKNVASTDATTAVFAPGGTTFGFAQNKPVAESKDSATTAVFAPAGTTFGFAQNKPVSESKDSATSAVFAAAGTSFGFGAQNKLVSESKDSEIKLSPVKTVASTAATTAVFAPSWSSGSLFNKQTPFSFGVQSSIPSNPVASNDADGDDEIEQPSSPSVKKTEEIGVTVVHEVKCKVYVKSTDPGEKDAWKDKGTGQLSIKCKDGVEKGTRDSKPTILVRNDVGRIVLNALLYPGIKTSMQKNSIVAIFHTSDDSGNDGGTAVARTFLIRTRSTDDRNKLAAAIQEYAPAA